MWHSGPFDFAQVPSTVRSHRSSSRFRSTVRLALDEKPHAKNRLSPAYDAGIASASSVESFRAAAETDAREALVLPQSHRKPRYARPHLRRHNYQSPSVLPPLVPALPCPQQSLPPFSSIMLSLNISSGASKPLRTDLPGDGCGYPSGRPVYVAPPSNTASQSPKVSHDSGLVSGNPSVPSLGTFLPLEHTNHGEAGIGNMSNVAISSLMKGVDTTPSTEFSDIKHQNLVIESRQWRMNAIPSYAVQLLNQDGSTPSKA